MNATIQTWNYRQRNSKGASYTVYAALVVTSDGARWQTADGNEATRDAFVARIVAREAR